MGLFNFKQKNPQTVLEGLDRAQKLLDERMEKKQVSLEYYQKQSMEFRKKREKYER